MEEQIILFQNYLKYRNEGLNKIIENLEQKLINPDSQIDENYYKEQLIKHSNYKKELEHIQTYLQKTLI